MIGFTCVIIMNVIFNYVGVDPFASPVHHDRHRHRNHGGADIPCKYMPVMLVLGSTLGNVMPGSLAAPISWPRVSTGAKTVSSTVRLGGRPLFIVFVFITSFFYINKMMKKDVAGGMKFEYGP